MQCTDGIGSLSVTHVRRYAGAAHAEAGEGVPEGVAEGEAAATEARGRRRSRSRLARRRAPLVGRHARHEEERERGEDVGGRQRRPQLRREGVQERVRRTPLAGRGGQNGLLQNKHAIGFVFLQ